MGTFKRVAAVDEIAPGKMKAFEIGFDRIVICRTENGIYALADECSHDGAPISDGRIDRQGNIVCPRHGARFACENGDVKAPPAVTGIESFETKIENNDIYVLLD